MIKRNGPEQQNNQSKLLQNNLLDVLIHIEKRIEAYYGKIDIINKLDALKYEINVMVEIFVEIEEKYTQLCLRIKNNSGYIKSIIRKVHKIKVCV